VYVAGFLDRAISDFAGHGITRIEVVCPRCGVGWQ
jgi:hypothetical protein